MFRRHFVGKCSNRINRKIPIAGGWKIVYDILRKQKDDVGKAGLSQEVGVVVA